MNILHPVTFLSDIFKGKQYSKLFYDQAFRLFFYRLLWQHKSNKRKRVIWWQSNWSQELFSFPRCLLSVAFAFLKAIFLFLTFLFVFLYFRIWLSVCNTTFITTFICLRTYFHWHFEVVVLTCILVSVIPHHTTFAFYGDGEPKQTKLERLSRLT